MIIGKERRIDTTKNVTRYRLARIPKDSSSYFKFNIKEELNKSGEDILSKIKSRTVKVHM